MCGSWGSGGCIGIADQRGQSKRVFLRQMPNPNPLLQAPIAIGNWRTFEG